MKLKLVRKIFNKTSTEGNFYVDEKWFCNTIEDVTRSEPGIWNKGIKIFGETAIPYGRYEVLVTYSNRFKRLLPILLNVPDFEGIRIHNGTSEKSSLGCVIVSYKDDDKTHKLINDKGAMNDLTKLILKAQKTQKIYIDIVK